MTKPLPGIDPADREADLFATHLLMPSAMVRDELGKLIHGKKFTEPADVIDEMARIFDVEAWRMATRLTEMGLLDRGYIRGDKV